MSKLELDLKTQDGDGREHSLFCCSYHDADGRHMSFYLYAISHEDALLQLEDLRMTARVDGELIETHKE